MGTYGSRSRRGRRLGDHEGLRQGDRQGKKIAAHLLEASEADIEFKDGLHGQGHRQVEVLRRGGMAAYVPHKFPLQEIEPGLKEGAFYDPDELHLPRRLPHLRGRGRSRDRASPTIVNWVAVDDFGTIINPMIVEGQVHGGIAQGSARRCSRTASTIRSGQLVTGSYMDYTMPRADDLPSFTLGFTAPPARPTRWASRAAARPARSPRRRR
jgi:aerobic carbon-monoxide dehydrogenase large subunit